MEFIKDSKLLFFDLDGTLYEGRQHFDIYAEEIAKELSADIVPKFTRDYELASKRMHPVTVGKAYDKDKKWILSLDPMTLQVFEAHTWDGRLIPEGIVEEIYKGQTLTNRTRYTLIGDGWWVPYVCAVHYGVVLTHAPYNRTKIRMHEKDYNFPLTPNLKENLTKLKETHRIILITNSDEADALKLVELLGLSKVFSEMVAPAKKPFQTKEIFKYFIEKYQVQPEEAISFGDNFINEIAPALELGMKAVHISHRGHWQNDKQLKVVPTLANLGAI